jgi:hypothetical protein
MVYYKSTKTGSRQSMKKFLGGCRNKVFVLNHNYKLASLDGLKLLRVSKLTKNKVKNIGTVWTQLSPPRFLVLGIPQPGLHGHRVWKYKSKIPAWFVTPQNSLNSRKQETTAVKFKKWHHTIFKQTIKGSEGQRKFVTFVTDCTCLREGSKTKICVTTYETNCVITYSKW